MNRGFVVIGILVVVGLGFAVYVQTQMRERERAAREEALAEAKDRQDEAKRDVDLTEEVPEQPNLPDPSGERPPQRKPAKKEAPDTNRAPGNLMQSGLAAAGKGEFEAAAADIAQASVLAPSDPEPVFYLSYLALVNQDWARSLRYLGLAMGKDEDWLKYAPHPRKLFGSDLAYQRYVTKLQAHVNANPTDADAKTLLAFHLYFTKGGTHAKAMAHEALSLDSGHAQAKALVAGLEKAGH